MFFIFLENGPDVFFVRRLPFEVKLKLELRPSHAKDFEPVDFGDELGRSSGIQLRVGL